MTDLTYLELQTLRNHGGYGEQAADEIERLQARVLELEARDQALAVDADMLRQRGRELKRALRNVDNWMSTGYLRDAGKLVAEIRAALKENKND